MNVDDHPIARIERTLGNRQRVALAWLVAILALAYVHPEDGTSVVGWALLIVLFGGAFAVFDYDRRRNAQADEVADLTARYADGEIDLDTFEQEVELVLDDRAQRIMTAVEEVGGVGPATASNIALRFRSVDDVRRADLADLEAVNGVGPQRAEAIAERVGEP